MWTWAFYTAFLTVPHKPHHNEDSVNPGISGSPGQAFLTTARRTTPIPHFKNKETGGPTQLEPDARNCWGRRVEWWPAGKWSRECWEESDMDNIITFLCDLMRWSQFQVKMKVLSHRDQNHTGSRKWVGLWLLDY